MAIELAASLDLVASQVVSAALANGIPVPDPSAVASPVTALDPTPSRVAALDRAPSGVATVDPATGGILQADGGVNVDVDLTPTNVVGSAVGAFLTTLVVGAIMVALAEDYTVRTMERIVDDAVGSFVYGLVSLVFLFLVTFVLVITIVGILVAIPLAILSYVVWAVGSAVAFLAVGDRLVGREDGWTKPLLVGAGINGLLTLTGIGGLLSFAVGAAGFGAVLRDWLERPS